MVEDEAIIRSSAHMVIVVEKGAALNLISIVADNQFRGCIFPACSPKIAYAIASDPYHRKRRTKHSYSPIRSKGSV
jgi:hypothetical protein